MYKPIFNRTKIIATLGPASTNETVLRQLFLEGLDVCRLNFSHGLHAEHLASMELVRKLNQELGLHVAIMCDIQGPKIRVGQMPEGGMELRQGAVFNLTTNKDLVNEQTTYITYPDIARDVKKGDRLLLDDGKMVLEVVQSNNKDLVETVVVHGGQLKSNKGVNLPNTNVSLPCITDKDLEDLEFILDHNPDWIALSFVREAYDILTLRQILESRQSAARIIAKIEKPQALKNIDSIIDAADAIMIARGDLGVELPIEELPMAQKRIVKKCLVKSKPVIIATQIMESMVTSPQPTRAEINDVANAVLDGADALMLSAETSVGQFPVEVIRKMQRIIGRVEEELPIYNQGYLPQDGSPTFLSDALCKYAVETSQAVGAKAIASMTVSGYTAMKISSFRPKAHVFIFSGNKKLLTQISLVWGVRGFFYNNYVSTDQTIEEVNAILMANGLVFQGDIVINTASMPIKERMRTNTIKISVI
ncbi:MAG: pyruvate kinase [Bacteroidetes bacterium]|nr:pyruvate kinase [Bacteroidota bacterium]